MLILQYYIMISRVLRITYHVCISAGSDAMLNQYVCMWTFQSQDASCYSVAAQIKIMFAV